MHFIKIRSGESLTYLRYSFDAFFHTLRGFEHRSGRTAATISVAVADQDIIVDILILIAVPSTHNRIRVQHAIVCGKEACLRLADAECCNHVCKDLASIDSFPVHRIIRNFVELVPCQFRGHKIVNTAFFQDLRHRRTVSEHIRQPQDLVVYAKFLPEEAFSKQKLAHKGFSGGQITVCLNPHAAFRLPASFFDSLADFLVYLRMSFLHKAVELRLARHKVIIRIFFHQL